MTETQAQPPTPTNTYSGIAVLEAGDASDSFDDDAGPWKVHGVAMTEDTITHGSAGVPRFWPEETLREAAELLEGRPVVKNYHELDGQAPADDVIGKVTATGYADGVGIVYEGEIADPAIAKKVANGYLDVSVVPHISAETYDAERDVHVVDEIHSFRDIAVVAEGAVEGNEINMGPNPAVSVLSAAPEALSRMVSVACGAAPEVDRDVDEKTDAKRSTPLTTPATATVEFMSSTDTDADALQADTRLDAWAAFLASVAGNVDPDALALRELHALLAAEIPDAGVDDVADALPAAQFADDAGADAFADAIGGLLDGSGDGADGEAAGDESDAGEDTGTDANAAHDADYDPLPDPNGTGVGALLAQELLGDDYTDPRDIRTVKDGAQTVDVERSDLARDVLGIDEPDEPRTVDPAEDAVAQQVLGEDDDEEPPTYDPAHDPVAGQIAGQAPDASADGDAPGGGGGVDRSPSEKWTYGKPPSAAETEDPTGIRQLEHEPEDPLEDPVNRAGVGLDPVDEPVEDPEPVVDDGDADADA